MLVIRRYEAVHRSPVGSSKTKTKTPGTRPRPRNTCLIRVPVSPILAVNIIYRGGQTGLPSDRSALLRAPLFRLALVYECIVVSESWQTLR